MINTDYLRGDAEKLRNMGRADAVPGMLDDSADEIERLRSENYKLRCRIQILDGSSVEDVELDSQLKEAE